MQKWRELFSEKFKEQAASFCSMMSIALISILLLTIIIFCFGDKIHHFYSNHIIISESVNLTPHENKHINELVSKGKIVSISDAYTTTVSYYDSLISVLATLLGVFALVSWFANKGKVRNDVEDIIQKYFDSRYYDADMQEYLKKGLNDNLKRMIEEQGVKDELRNEITQLVIDNIEIEKKQDTKVLTLEEKE